MSWDNTDWERRDADVADRPANSIFFPREAPHLMRAMVDYLSFRRLEPAVALGFGWYPSFFKGPRIIMPCIRTDAYNFWQGRLLDQIVEGEMLYRPWKRWESPYGPRGDSLCYLRVPRSKVLIIVEGPMDALAAAQAGASAIATLGVAAPDRVLSHVATLAQEPYDRRIIVPDKDEVGKWTSIQSALGSMGVHATIREPYAKDLADMSQQSIGDLLYGP